MKNKKILSSILVLALVFGLSSFVQSKDPIVEVDTYNGLSNFEDMIPILEHGEPYVDTVISCNMVLKPKTQIDLSRLCSSAVTNVSYYFNGSASSTQKGPDYNNTVKNETFYPASKRISDSYLGGTISYQVISEFQTTKSTGDKITLVTPMEEISPTEKVAVFKTAVIISSITKQVDLGVATTISVPTGDQSQPNWTFITPAYSRYKGVMYDYPCYFGSAADNNSSMVSAFLGRLNKSSRKESVVVGNVEADWFPFSGDFIPEGTAGYSDNLRDDIVFDDERIAAAKEAKSFILQFCEDENYVWINAPKEQNDRISKDVQINGEGKEEIHILHPHVECRGYYRILAVSYSGDPSYRPAKRVRVKSRISTYGGFKFNNLVDGDVVKIYTVSGQKVAELTTGDAEGFEWKGRKGTNNSGDWAKSGIYIYQIKLKEQGKIISGTIVLAY